MNLLVAPQVTPKEGLPFHEWFIEFDQIKDNLEAIEIAMDNIMQRQNIYYKDLMGKFYHLSKYQK